MRTAERSGETWGKNPGRKLRAGKGEAGWQPELLGEPRKRERGRPRAGAGLGEAAASSLVAKQATTRNLSLSFWFTEGRAS